MSDIVQMNFVEMDHEVRIRLLEELVKENKSRFDKLETKMDSQFHWVLGTIFGQIAMTITLFGGIILHMAKLI